MTGLTDYARPSPSIRVCHWHASPSSALQQSDPYGNVDADPNAGSSGKAEAWRVRLLPHLAVLLAGAGLCMSVSAQSLPDMGSPPAPLSDLEVEAVTDAGTKSLKLDDRGNRKNYWLPGLEIIAFDVLLNRFDHAFVKPDDYDVSMRSIRRNLRSSWGIDRDPFTINQFLHPYQGSIYHGFARSAGLNYWEAFAYTFAGSIFWEIAGETTPPSRNDQVASGIGGAFLGESLFRLANLVLEDDTRLSPFWREVAAAAISPSTGFNRAAFGDRFDEVFASRDPAFYRRLTVGARTTLDSELVNGREIRDTEAVVDFAIDYGLPGKPGYIHTRPFDYFTLQVSASTGSGVESVMNRGLLYGRNYEVGERYRGIWGLYGGYDYLSAQLFRVSSTALSIGTTGQWWLSDAISLQGSGTAGIGYNAAATIRGNTEREYRYGFAPQAAASLRVIFGEKASLDLDARKFYVTDTTLGDRGGEDHILRAVAGFTYRIHREHALTLRYSVARRNVASPALPDQNQERTTIGLFYTNLGNDGFGRTDWR